MEMEKVYQLALHFTPGIGHYTIKQLISYCGSAEAVFKKTKGQLGKIPGIGPRTVEAISSGKSIAAAEDEILKAQKNNIQILAYTDKAFPKRLRGIHDAPAIVFYKGSGDLNQVKCVAVVGTRNATDYGRNFTNSLMEALSPHRPLIISGLAYGIDIVAHRAALKNNLPTIGIVASGVDIIYPAVHKETAHQMIKMGGLLSEFRTGTKPEPQYFPARNRIIAGMADLTIVIEAAKKGGALITAEIANSYNKDVFALPGNVGNKYSEGCNNLIKANKAHALTSIDDIEYIMNWAAAAEDPAATPLFDDSLLNDDEKQVIKFLIDNDKGIQLDELSWQTQIPLNKLASILLNLEFKGAVSSLPGKKYKLLKAVA